MSATTRLWLYVLTGVVAIFGYFAFLLTPIRIDYPNVQTYQTDSTKVIIIKDSLGTIKIEGKKR